MESNGIEWIPINLYMSGNPDNSCFNLALLLAGFMFVLFAFWGSEVIETYNYTRLCRQESAPKYGWHNFQLMSQFEKKSGKDRRMTNRLIMFKCLNDSNATHFWHAPLSWCCYLLLPVFNMLSVQPVSTPVTSQSPQTLLSLGIYLMTITTVTFD